MMDEDTVGFSMMDMNAGYSKSRKDRFHGKLSFILLVSGVLVISVLFVMSFVIFDYQERKFAELERSMMSHNSSLNAINSELKGKLEDTGPQMKMLSDVQTSVNNLGSLLGSLSSKLETKQQDAAGQQDGQCRELKSFVEHLNTSLSELAAKLQDTVMRQDVKLSEIGDSLTAVNSLLASFESKQQKRTQDSDQRVMAALSEMKAKLESNSKAAESQNRTLIEVVKLSSSVASLSSKLQSTDQRVMAALSDMKTKLESSSKTAESQNRTLIEVVKLSSSVASLSSKLQSTDQRVMATLSDMKTKLDSSSKTAESQSRTLTEVVKLSSSVESLSSKLQSTDQRVMAALSEMKAKLESGSKTAGGSTCKPGWTLYGSKCYFFSDDKLNWHQARDYCRSQNALLLKLEAKDERAFVTARTTSDFYWVGLTDENTGQWRWDDGTPYVMNKDEWEPGQPDNWKDHGLGEEGEDCGHIKMSGKFNDAHCSIKMQYICKA
ncbi:C-type lectin domain family 4 member F-like isoform X1 [Colossoma macropomum]|uniref:C-type lectin domain family 4 member F-like isoform X1 n=1 Tax=Colossoma macropomum TaxID=42526 RepID=UPI001864BD1D|nr:C-type lectin domain family 4 member F-like isoform X1 [Colossoma macropomum]